MSKPAFVEMAEKDMDFEADYMTTTTTTSAIPRYENQWELGKALNAELPWTYRAFSGVLQSIGIYDGELSRMLYNRLIERHPSPAVLAYDELANAGGWQHKLYAMYEIIDSHYRLPDEPFYINSAFVRGDIDKEAMDDYRALFKRSSTWCWHKLPKKAEIAEIKNPYKKQEEMFKAIYSDDIRKAAFTHEFYNVNPGFPAFLNNVFDAVIEIFKWHDEQKDVDIVRGTNAAESPEVVDTLMELNTALLIVLGKCKRPIQDAEFEAMIATIKDGLTRLNNRTTGLLVDKEARQKAP